MDQEHDDYADQDLSPPRSWLPAVAAVLSTVLVLFGIVVVYLMWWRATWPNEANR